MQSTKKRFFINGLSAVTLITMASIAHANAPAMRGEIGQVHAPTNAVNLSSTKTTIPTPKAAVGNVQKITTVHIPQTTAQGSAQIDSTLIDDFIEDVSPNARHYPPNFPSRTAEYYTGENVKHLSAWLEPYATAPNASFEVLIRAAKINALGRNLNLGTEYGIRASTHIAKALTLQPNHGEANFLYGAMLSEGGGFNEGKKYLDRAVAAGFLEAEQSLAQSDLLNDNRPAALSRLQRLASEHPSNAQIAEQLRIVQNGGYYIWDIKDNDINVKSVSVAEQTTAKENPTATAQ